MYWPSLQSLDTKCSQINNNPKRKTLKMLCGPLFNNHYFRKTLSISSCATRKLVKIVYTDDY